MLRLGAILLLLVVVVGATAVVAKRDMCRKEKIVALASSFVDMIEQSPDHPWSYSIPCHPNGRQRQPCPRRWPLIDWLNKHAAHIRGYNLTYDRSTGQTVCLGDGTDAVAQEDLIIIRPNYRARCYPWEWLWRSHCIGKDDPLSKYLM